jgi:hypothetical protein
MFHTTSHPPVVALTTILNSYGHETSRWHQSYDNNPSFTATYQALGVGKQVPKFLLQDALLCYLVHLCVPSSEHAKIIWEAHCNGVEGKFNVENTIEVLQKYFYWPKLQHEFNKYIILSTSSVIAKPTIKKNGLYTPLPTPNNT